MLVRVHSNSIFIAVGDVHKRELGQFVGFLGIRAYESFWFDFSQNTLPPRWQSYARLPAPLVPTRFVKLRAAGSPAHSLLVPKLLAPDSKSGD